MLLPPVAEGRERTLDADMDMRRTSVSSFAGPDTPLLDGLSEQQSPSATPSPQPPHQQPRMRPSLETMGGGSSEAEEPLMEGARAQEEREREQEEHERGPAPPYVEAVSRDSGVAFDSTEDGHASPATTSLPPASARRSSSGRRPGILGRAESAVSVLDPHNGRLSHLLHIFQPGQRQAATSEPTALPMPTPAPESPRPSGEQPSPPRRRPRGVTVAGPAPTPGSPYRTHRPATSSASALSAMFRTRSNTSGSGIGTPGALTSPSLISLHSISAPLTHTVLRTEYTYPRSGPTPDQMKFLASVDSFKKFGVPYGPDAVAYAASVSRVDLAQPPPVFEEVAGEGAGASGGTHSRSTSGSGSESVGHDGMPVSSNEPGSGPSPQAAPASDETSPPADTEHAPPESEAQSSALESPTAPESSSPAAPAPEPLTAEDVKKILRSAVPPTSYKPKTPISPLSTASSRATFATAEESLHGPGSPDTVTEMGAKPAIVVVEDAVESAVTPTDAVGIGEKTIPHLVATDAADEHANASKDVPSSSGSTGPPQDTPPSGAEGSSHDTTKSETAIATPFSPTLPSHTTDENDMSTTLTLAASEVPPV